MNLLLLRCVGGCSEEEGKALRLEVPFLKARVAGPGTLLTEHSMKNPVILSISRRLAELIEIWATEGEEAI